MKLRFSIFSALALTLLFGALAECAPGGATAKSRPRVRKELRSLSDAEYKAFVSGLATLMAVPTKAGRLLWGPHYVSYTDLLMKHAVAANDPRGDQGHNGPQLLTFHRAWLLQLEQSLLAVNPSLGALPYWHMPLDQPGGRYHGTSRYIFSQRYAGGISGNPQAGYGMSSGVFGWRQVPAYVPQQWPARVQAIFNGTAGGPMRSRSNLNGGPLVTRNPTANVPALVPELVPQLPALQKAFTDDFLQRSGTGANATWALRYREGDFLRCTDPGRYRSWVEWHFCVDFTVLMAAQTASNMSDAEVAKYAGVSAGSTSLLHAALHVSVGSFGSGDISDKGDLADVATSPNDALIFAAHHANLDRSLMTWQAAAAAARPAAAAGSWGYPASRGDYPAAVRGTLLRDVLTSAYPFQAPLFARAPRRRGGYTHEEVIQLTAPGVSSPYTYDTLVQ